MEWIDQPTRRGVRIRSFTLDRGDRSIPGLVWDPEEARSGPLVLIGHGGSGSAFEDHVGALARRLVRDYGATCLAIDGPVHGQRRGDRSQDPTLVMLDFSQVWSSDPTMTDDMVNDWRFALDATIDELGLQDRPVGYWGFSMGTLLGLPLIAAEPRVIACVLGLAGIIGPTAQRLENDAPKVTCPTLFLMQWNDELFSQESCFALFDALGTNDKQLLATPGAHSAVTNETFLRSAEFLGSRLSAGQHES